MSVLTQANSLLSTVSNKYIGSMPDSPANAIVLRSTGGFPRSLSGTYLEEPTFQIKVRNASYATGFALCETIAGLLHGATTTKLLMIEQMGGINDIGRDENNRPEWTMNFRCYYRK